jgi:penicillin-binding protein 2
MWNALNTDSTKPLFNRATMTNYPPGSTYKMVLAAAALQEKIIDENYRITCYGAYRFGNRVFKDLRVHGSTNVVQAIQKSCNVFFYQLIHKVGFEKWTEYGRKFGFGRKTGIDIGEESAGLIPSIAYYDRVYGKGGWTQGFLVSLAVGQGEIGVSPLQMAMYAAALANGGTLHQPHAVNFIRNKVTNRMERVEYQSTEIGLSPVVMELIREGMRQVVEETGGTALRAKIPGIVTAGKTGTAQNPHGDDHAWFVGFAPFENPTIAVAIMLENAGGGGVKAAPLASLVMQKYIKGMIEKPHYRPRPKPAAADTTERITELRHD